MLEFRPASREEEAEEALDLGETPSAEVEGIANSAAAEAEDSPEEEDSSEEDDFSLESSDSEESDDSIIAEDVGGATTEGRRETATEGRREATTEGCTDAEGGGFGAFARPLDRVLETTGGCIETEVVISAEGDGFEVFAAFLDRVVMVKGTALRLDGILAEIRMSSRFTNESFEMKDRDSTRKLQEKITILMGTHLSSRLNIKESRDARMPPPRPLRTPRRRSGSPSNRRFHTQNRGDKRGFSHMDGTFTPSR